MIPKPLVLSHLFLKKKVDSAKRLWDKGIDAPRVSECCKKKIRDVEAFPLHKGQDPPDFLPRIGAYSRVKARKGPYRPNHTHFSQPLLAIRTYTRGKNQVEDTEKRGGKNRNEYNL